MRSTECSHTEEPTIHSTEQGEPQQLEPIVRPSQSSRLSRRMVGSRPRHRRIRQPHAPQIPNPSAPAKVISKKPRGFRSGTARSAEGERITLRHLHTTIAGRSRKPRWPGGSERRGKGECTLRGQISRRWNGEFDVVKRFPRDHHILH
jgi:hypothetical protein